MIPALQSSYMDMSTRTICDLSEFPMPDGTPAWIVNRVNTPQQSRGQGHASRLMREVILPKVDEADIILYLDIVASGGLTYAQLAQWYHRLGFRHRTVATHKIWVRYPIK